MSAVAPPSESRVLEGLSAAQRAAVVHGDGPLLVIAGAGTGKTTVLTRRIAHLIASKRARPEEILALTFTDKAAAEMSERVDQLIPYGYAETTIGTFHAFGDRVLREAALDAGLDPEFRVLSRPEQILFLRERLFRLPLRRFRPLGEPTRHLGALLTLVSRAKDENVSPARYRRFAEERLERARDEGARDEAERELELADFYAAYQSLLAEAGLVDFGDQIYRTLEVLRDRPALRERLASRYRYVLVDEFQDTNHAQLELVRLLAPGSRPNVSVVGDDDQAIYRWRGAAAGNLVAFRAAYPELSEVVLRENHRSTQQVLDAASRLISYNNPWRLEVAAGIDKRLVSTRAPGPDVAHLHFETASAEADGVAAVVEERLRAGHRARDLAVLVRSNADADAILRSLNVRELPYRFSGGEGLFDRPEIRQLVCVLRALAEPDDSVSVFHLAGAEPYAVPARDLVRLNRFAARRNRPLLEVLRVLPDEEDLAAVGGQARGAAQRLLRDLDAAAEELPRRRTGEVLYGYLQRTGMLAELAREANAESEARVTNVARFFEVIRRYGELVPHDRVPEFVRHLAMLREAGEDPADAGTDLDAEAIQVLTVHKAKGLEFPVVVMAGLVEGRFPVRRRREPLDLPPELFEPQVDGGDAALLEERRLFYVGMTRARDELVLTSAADYGSPRLRKVSRFVVEALDLPSPLPRPRRRAAIEALAVNAPVPDAQPPALAPERALRLSFRQIDDYRTCPLKYRYVHRLRVPLLAHHRVVYGSAIHRAIQELYRSRVEQRPFTGDDLVAAFRRAWVSEGFLSRQHEELRLAEGESALRAFYEAEERAPLGPTGVEEEFAFHVGPTRVIGRYDLVIEREGALAILDFKTGSVRDADEAQRRAAESLQLDVYSLACLRTRGRLPDRVELRFVESGLVGSRRPTEEEAERTAGVVEEVAAALRRGEFPATPSFLACGQCAFRDICPHTARGTGEPG